MHPMLVVFPLGLLMAALIFDVVYFATGSAGWGFAAFWNAVVGVGGGLIAAVPGMIDYLSIPSGTRARTVGTMHAVGNAIVLGCFGVSALLRLERPEHVPAMASLVLEIVGAFGLLLTGWLGGELVERHGVGVAEDAGYDAPGSIGQFKRV
jgi:uncharacterized membrane protein